MQNEDKNIETFLSKATKRMRFPYNRLGSIFITVSRGVWRLGSFSSCFSCVLSCPSEAETSLRDVLVQKLYKLLLPEEHVSGIGFASFVHKQGDQMSL
jgi:hypothetical protein